MSDPVELTTARLVLDQPGADDIDTIAEFCADPLFERFMTTPWPYERHHAEMYVEQYVPNGWQTGGEATWVLRLERGAPLMGVVGIRSGSGEIGFWLGAPHRGHGYMPEAVRAVIAWAHDGGMPGVDDLLWRAEPGNRASASVARATGFRFTGEVDPTFLDRSGSPAAAWIARRGRSVDHNAAASWAAVLEWPS